MRTISLAVAVALVCSTAVASQDGRTLTGVLTNTDDPDDQIELTIHLSGQYRPIYRYEGRSGPRAVELTEVGQVVQFVPSGGGVQTIEVAALEASRARIHWVVNTSFEKSGMVLTQSYGREAATLVAAGAGYDATFQIVTTTRLSDLDLSVGGNPDVTVYKGVLR